MKTSYIRIRKEKPQARVSRETFINTLKQARNITLESASWPDYLYTNKEQKRFREIAINWLNNPDSPGYFIGHRSEIWEIFPTHFTHQLLHPQAYPDGEYPFIWAIKSRKTYTGIRGNTPVLKFYFTPIAECRHTAKEFNITL